MQGDDDDDWNAGQPQNDAAEHVSLLLLSSGAGFATSVPVQRPATGRVPLSPFRGGTLTVRCSESGKEMGPQPGGTAAGPCGHSGGGSKRPKSRSLHVLKRSFRCAVPVAGIFSEIFASALTRRSPACRPDAWCPPGDGTREWRGRRQASCPWLPRPGGRSNPRS